LLHKFDENEEKFRENKACCHFQGTNFDGKKVVNVNKIIDYENVIFYKMAK
jgi:hypothetical protein